MKPSMRTYICATRLFTGKSEDYHTFVSKVKNCPFAGSWRERAYPANNKYLEVEIEIFSNPFDAKCIFPDARLQKERTICPTSI